MMPDSLAPIWGLPTLFRIGTDETFAVPATPDGATCRLEFGRELVCELRPRGAELEGSWRFGLHQMLQVPDGAAAATVRHELRLFVYKPAGARVTVKLQTARAFQALLLREEAVSEGEHLLELSAPLALKHGGHAVWVAVEAHRAAGTEQVLVTVDALALTLA